MEIEAGGQMTQHINPRFGHCSRTIETHGPFCSKHPYWCNKAYVLIESRNDFLSHKSTGRHMMCPSQAVDVSRQAFTPNGTNFVGNKIVEPTTRSNMLPEEHIGPGISDLYHHTCLLHLTYPASCCSSGMVAPPISSRTGPRFPGRPRGSGIRGCFSSCLLWEASGR